MLDLLSPDTLGKYNDFDDQAFSALLKRLRARRSTREPDGDTEVTARQAVLQCTQVTP